MRKKEWIFLILLTLTSLLVRAYKANDIISFDTDQEFFALEAKKILVDHKLTLIGIPTQFGGVLIGPLFTYLAAFFFWVLKGNPASTHVLTILLNTAAVPISYWVVKKLFGNWEAIIASIIVAFSYSSMMDSLAGWAVTPVMATTFVFVYCLTKFLSGNQKYFSLAMLVTGIGFNWHIMTGFYLVAVFFSVILLRPRLSLRHVLIGIFLFILTLSPLILFDLRHNFINTKGAISLFNNTSGSKIENSPQKVVSIAIGNSGAMIFPQRSGTSNFFAIATLVTLIIYVAKNKKILATKALLIFGASIIFAASFYKGHLSEQYIAPFSTIFVIIFSFILAKLPRVIVITLLLFFIFINTRTFIQGYNSLSLKYKMEAVNYIVNDSQNNDFILHIDSGFGYGSGFNYLFYYLKKEPKEKGNNLYLIGIPWSQKHSTTTEMVKNSYKANNPVFNSFGDIEVIKIQ